MQAGIASPAQPFEAPAWLAGTAPLDAPGSRAGKLQDAAKETPVTRNHGMAEVWKGSSRSSKTQPSAQHHRAHH